MGIDLKFEPISGKGAIYAYTIMYHAGDKRFAAAIPMRASSWSSTTRPGPCWPAICWAGPYTEAKVGRRVEVIFEPLNDGHHAAAVSSRARA